MNIHDRLQSEITERHIPPDSETCRILRAACNRAIRLEQQHWPRRPVDIERSKRLHRYAERFNAFIRKGVA